MEKCMEKVIEDGDNVCTIRFTTENIFLLAYKNVSHCGGTGRRYFGSDRGINKKNLFFSTNLVFERKGNNGVSIYSEEKQKPSREIFFQKLEVEMSLDSLWFFPTFEATGVFVERLAPWGNIPSENDNFLIDLPSPIGYVIVRANLLPKGYAGKVKFSGLRLPSEKSVIRRPHYERSCLRYGKCYVYNLNKEGGGTFEKVERVS